MSKTLKKTILFFGIILSSLIVNGQTNYYVSSTGNNTHNGTLSSPWLTIQYGLDQLSTGDILNVMSGTYNEKLQINTSGIILQNYSSVLPIIDASGITSQTAIIEIFDVSDILIHGFELKNSIMLDAQGILVEGNCQNIVIEGCKIHDIHFSSDVNAPANAGTNAQGIVVYGSNSSIAISNLKILSNLLYNCRLGYSEGIAVNGNVNGFEISGNTIYNLTNIGIDLCGHEGTCSDPAFDQARNGFVKNNIVYNCISPYATSGGIYVDGAKNITIENNISYLNGYGIEVGCENIGESADSIIVRDNIFYNNQVCAIAVGGYAYPNGSGKVMNTAIRNNTCYYNDYSNSGFGELYLSYSENSVIENNIFYTSSQDILTYAELTQPNLSFNYNIFYCQSGAGSLLTNWNGNNYNNYSSFITGSGTNINSAFADPLFVLANITNPDFHITATSPAINAGNPSFIPAFSELDIDGEIRANGIVDCGADEYFPNTGLNENGFTVNQVKIYPNPANDYITITSSNIRRVTIYNSLGKQIGVFLTENKSETQVNVKYYSVGLYFLVAFDKDLQPVCSQSFIKE